MKKVVSLIFIALLIVCLCSCDFSPKITSGEVYKKEYKPAYSSTEVSVVFNGNQANAIPISEYHPERYVIYIKALVDSEWVFEEFIVPEYIYMDINIGDTYTHDIE